MTLQFEDTVRTIEERDGKVEVTFNRQSAFYWTSADKTDVVQALRTARQDTRPVSVDWNPATLEIVNVR